MYPTFAYPQCFRVRQARRGAGRAMRRGGVLSLSIVGAAAETGLRGSVRHAAGPYALATPFAFSYVRKPPRPSMPASSVMSALRSRSGGVGMPAAADPHASKIGRAHV